MSTYTLLLKSGGIVTITNAFQFGPNHIAGTVGGWCRMFAEKDIQSLYKH